MTSLITNIKKLSQKNRFNIFLMIFFAMVLIFGIRAAYAYYHSDDDASIVISRVGNFDNSGDINIVVYKEQYYESGLEDLYVKSYAVPEIGFELNTVLCTISDCETTDSTEPCYYNFNPETFDITLSSDQKVTCKFYFNQQSDADIIVNIHRENIRLAPTNPKTYELVYEIPAYGYVYSAENSTCDNNVTPTYDPFTRRFNLSTDGKTTCDVYFDSIGKNLADITAHIYVQTEANTDSYIEVESIPSNVEYEISENVNRVSKCLTLDEPAQESTAPIIDEDGYLVINATERVVCEVYLDIVTE